MVTRVFSRTELMLGKERLEIIKQKSVMVFGLGGVGGFATEALARAGIGTFVLVDHDKVDITNINRQILALHSTLGYYKVDLMAKRIKDINPGAQVEVKREYYCAENAEIFFENNIPGYIIDAIDSVTSKVHLIINAKNENIPIVSCMGTGNKMDPSKLTIADISKTSVCPLARIVRQELRKKGIISGVDTVFSTERPVKFSGGTENTSAGNIPGSISFLPPVAGFLMASKVISEFLKDCS